MNNEPTVEQVLRDTDQKSANRCCFLLRVRTERLAEYLDVHQRVWDSMRAALTACGWRHYSLFVDPGTGLVVGYFESDDVAEAMAAMARTEVDAIWQAEMAQYFVPPDGGVAQLLPQYFHLG